MRYFTIIDNEVYDKDLFTYLEKGECLDKSPLANGTKSVIISSDNAYKAVEWRDDLIAILKDIESNPRKQCPCCGNMTNHFVQDYRGEECVSRYISCTVCLGLSDKHYFELFKMKNGEQAFEKLLQMTGLI